MYKYFFKIHIIVMFDLIQSDCFQFLMNWGKRYSLLFFFIIRQSVEDKNYKSA